MAKEAKAFEKYLTDDAYKIVLAIEGKKYDSLRFATMINNLGINGKSNIVFIIGGSLGVAESVKKKPDIFLSLIILCHKLNIEIYRRNGNNQSN